ncbi:MAG TPA: hypothetical protein IGS17_06850 [Oscillatoriales cyanobacterium M59_W2019_021]|nr:MAG: hypothetical protein D6728_19200 [Cyanobacteria bacterium J055]HIK32618.1 hypothetical protein [Oscillatoriales cyanobacterium M4454_W2019_049]HIK50631.1 hypothetical protein [Oscillatoriales cyanobacterium M59_W2019_021]
MNAALHRVLKSVYRKEPISSFILTMGAVDVAIGGLGNHWSLFSVGLGIVSLAIVLRWWQIQRFHETELEPEPETPNSYYLPPSAASPALPNLRNSRKRLH